MAVHLVQTNENILRFFLITNLTASFCLFQKPDDRPTFQELALNVQDLLYELQ